MKSDSVRIPIPICFIQHDTTENELAVEDGMEETKKLVEKRKKELTRGWKCRILIKLLREGRRRGQKKLDSG